MSTTDILNVSCKKDLYAALSTKMFEEDPLLTTTTWGFVDKHVDSFVQYCRSKYCKQEYE